MRTDNNKKKKKKERRTGPVTRFPERAKKDWIGPIISFREVDLLRKFMTSSAKLMSRKRSGTNAQEQACIKNAIKQARFMALLPYTGP